MGLFVTGISAPLDVERPVNLLLFTVEHMRLGVYAKQVEELLDVDTYPISLTPEGYLSIEYHHRMIRCLDFAAYLRRYQTVFPQGTASERREASMRRTVEPETLWQENGSLRRSGKILVAKHWQEGVLGVLIEHPKKLLTISVEQIHALPVLMEKKSQLRAVWGIALIDDLPVILVNVEQL